MDVGVLGDIPFQPAISRDQVAQAAGTTIKEIIALHHEGRAMTAMAEGASKIINDLLEKGEVDGVIAAGGSLFLRICL
jgi:uncharacterized protein (UPF0261 family)